MGKKSRAKQQRRNQEIAKTKQAKQTTQHKERSTGAASLLLWIMRIGTALALFTPFVLSKKHYFPFVGPKSIYFMALAQIVFFSWLILAVHYKRYRPTINKVLTAFIIFFIVLIIASVSGVDFSRSFWSKFERMTGLLMWIHLFGWFLAISSSFKRLSDWRGIFWVTTGIATLISFLTLLGEVGVAVWEQGGSSLGNTSFLGSYLLFNVFIALYLFFKEKNINFRVAALIATIVCGFGIYLAGARAATLGMLGGFGLIILLYLSFKLKKKSLRTVGKIALVLASVAVLVGIIMLFIPDTPVSNKFIELTTASRTVNWSMAWKGFFERPLFGWGPENYIVLFPKFFNSCLFTLRCGGEIWFDRTHNIVLDTLATTGIAGLLAYLGMFVVMFLVLIKKYFKEKSISFWTFSIFTALFVGYFVQNLTVFDMIASLMMFILTVSFIGFLATKDKPERQANKQVKPWVVIVLLVVFLLTFFEFVIQPYRTGAFVIQAVISPNPNERIEYYKKTFESSLAGKYQIRDFFAQEAQKFIKDGIDNSIPRELAVKELDFITDELKKTREESPLDFRATLKLAQVYNVYALVDGRVLSEAEKYGQEALELSPTNQQAFWTLAQTKVYLKDFETALDLAMQAVDLEVEWLNSYKVAVQIAQKAGKEDKVEEIIQRATEINPEWASKFDDIINAEK